MERTAFCEGRKYFVELDLFFDLSMRKASGWNMLDIFRDLEEREIGKHFAKEKRIFGMTIEKRGGLR